MTFVPRPVLTFAVGVAGHRPSAPDQPKRLFDEARIKERLANVFAAIGETCRREYEAACDVHASNAAGDPAKPPYRVRLLTGFAEGTDQFAAGAAPACWEVEAILVGKQEECEAAFLPPLSSDKTDRLEAFRDALKRAEGRIVQLPSVKARPARCDKAPTDKELEAARQAGYARQGEFIVKQIDLLVAVWDGERSEERGSTYDVVMAALARRVPVVWISATEDRAPWLLLRPEDALRETEAPDALDGPLRDAMAVVLRPPASSRVKAGERPPRRRLEDFLAETDRVACGWFAYDCLKRGWRAWTWRLRIPLDDQDAARAQWRPFLDRAPDGKDFRARLESVLLPRYHAADQIATHYSHAYRSAYVLAYFLATVAVFVTMLGTLPLLHRDPPAGLHIKAGLVAFELIVIFSIIGIVRQGLRHDWHGRWLDARALAERLRHERFVSLMGRGDVARAEADISSTGAAWTSWYLRATIRELGQPFGALDAAYQRNALLAAREFELVEQLDFNKANHATLKRLNHGLHFWGDISFFATALVLSLFLLGWLLALALGTDVKVVGETCTPEGSAACVLDGLKPLVVLLAAVLPAMGAALAGVRFTGDFEQFAERSRETAERLGRMQGVYERALDRDEFDLTADTLAETARIMAEDLSDWRSLYARKILTLPA